MTGLIVTAPMKGWAAPLDQVPDPVFADRMMGDGVAIQPLGNQVHAPFDGVVTNLHSARHAISVRSDAGAEVLIHVGLETVALNGQGFEALVAVGDRVACGDPLLAFDLDAVAQSARSLITPVVVTNSEAFRIVRRTTGQGISVYEGLMTLEPIAVAARVMPSSDGSAFTRTVRVPMVHGIHARPAARISECARKFESEVVAIRGDRRANVRGAVALMGLGVRMGDDLLLEARGHDAPSALAAIGDLIANGMGETLDDLSPSQQQIAPLKPPPVLPRRERTVPEGAIGGVMGATGLAMGTARWLNAAEIPVEVDGRGADSEHTALTEALNRVCARLFADGKSGRAEQDAIVAAHLAFLDDPDINVAARSHIAAGRSAGFAWRAAIDDQAAVLRDSGDPRLAERADDLKDLEQQVLVELSGAPAPSVEPLPAGTILLARDLLPSHLIAWRTDGPTGIVLVNGGATSHVAILCASRGIPLLVATGEALVDVSEGTVLALDADAGLVHVAPDTDAAAQFQERIALRQMQRDAAQAAAHELCYTQDGTRIEVFANLGSRADAVLAVRNGAEGSGLLRTEFLFLDRVTAPDEDEQADTYQAIAEALDGRPLIVRLLDIGGDKPAAYLPMEAEANPALGLRGIRVGLAHPDLLQTQIRAILRVNPVGQCRIMLPMVSSLSELRRVRELVDAECHALSIDRRIAVGVMVETPAAAAIADLLAGEADFLSIGTNDLTQYVLAMDRENPGVAAGIDALHPAVLRLIGLTCDGAAVHRRMVGVCGGLASDPVALPLLIGLGVTELSVTPGFVAEAKALVRRLDFHACRALVRRANDLSSPAHVRDFARRFIEDLS